MFQKPQVGAIYYDEVEVVDVESCVISVSTSTSSCHCRKKLAVRKYFWQPKHGQFKTVLTIEDELACLRFGGMSNLRLQ